MNEAQAQAIVAELKAICEKYGLWFTLEFEHKPNMKIIRIREISIKITNR